MKFLVFQHVECEHPGSLRGFMEKAGVEWDVVELDQGDSIPSLQGYDALWVMGGPMDVWDVDEHPWLVKEKEAIRTWVRELKKPYLGLCLGHQLLADALGGTCGPQRPPEVGLMTVELTEEGRQDPIMRGLPDVQKCLQWHSVCVAQPPQNAVVLAKSDGCRVQAMRIGQHIWSMQYHVEVERETVENWSAIPEYHAALVEVLGQEGADSLQLDVAGVLPELTSVSERLFANFLATIVNRGS